jgi:cytochrome c biogenesis protein CcmG/thiol:disulfide interchange protein DsbE
MPALATGVRAPEIKLMAVGGGKFKLSEELKKGPVVAAFFKVSCPVCQMAFPYIERLFQVYGKSGKVTLIGVSQDGAADTQAFNREFGVTFPVLIDEKGYPVSTAYGLTNVPTVFLISQEGEIERSIVSWSKADMEELNRKLAEISGVNPSALFHPGERVAEFRPG